MLQPQHTLLGTAPTALHLPWALLNQLYAAFQARENRTAPELLATAVELYHEGELHVRLCSAAGITLTSYLVTFHKVLTSLQAHKAL